MSAGIYTIRVLLINIGKILPFLICLVVALSYTECLYALMCGDFLSYEGYIVLNKPVSWTLGSYLSYNIQMLCVLVVLSFAVETCINNKLACLYLGVNLIEKSYFASVELYVEYIYVAVLLNMLASGFFVYKGFVILTKNR